MVRKQLAMLGALLGIANPGYAFDDSFDNVSRAQAVMFYYAIPLDAQSRKESKPWMGMLVQGRQDYRGGSFGGVGLDSRLFTLLEESGSTVSMVLIGVAAVGTAAVVMHKGKSNQQQVQNQPQQPAPPSQVPCTTGCPTH